MINGKVCHFCLASTVSGRYKNPLWSKNQKQQADKTARLTRHPGWRGSQAVKAPRLSRQPGCHGSQAVKVARLSRQPGCQGSQADKTDRLTAWQGSQACLLCFWSACFVMCPLLVLALWSGYYTNHRHLSNKDCLISCTACLVCFISTVNGCSKKSLERLALVAGT